MTELVIQSIECIVAWEDNLVKRRLFQVLMVITCLLLFSSCESVKNSLIITENHIEQWDALNTYDILLEKGNNYEVYTDEEQTAFHYFVKDNNGILMDEGYHNWRGSFSFNTVDNILQLNYGYGSSLWDERYYDVETGRVSRFFPRPLQTYGETVAYFATTQNEEIILIVQNMFDPSHLYKEFRCNFSDMVIRGDCKAEFLNDGRQLKVTYWKNPNDEEVTEVFELQ